MKLLRRCPEGSTFIDSRPSREVDLHGVRALLEAAAHLAHVLAQEVLDELLFRESASRSSRGRGMLPIGSVGMDIQMIVPAAPMAARPKSRPVKSLTRSQSIATPGSRAAAPPSSLHRSR